MDMATILPKLDKFLNNKTITSTLFEPCRVTLFFSDDSQITFQAQNKKDPSNFYTDLKTLAQENIEYNI